MLGSLSLIGLPGTSGHTTKELLLASTALGQPNALAHGLLMLAAAGTVYYSLKLFYYGFENVYTFASARTISSKTAELSIVNVFSLGMLSFGSIISGKIDETIFQQMGGLLLRSHLVFSPSVDI